PSVLLYLATDDLGSTTAKIHDLGPVKISGWQLDTTVPQLVRTIDPKPFRPLLRRHVVFSLGVRLRQLAAVVREHGDVRQRGRLCDRALLLHDQHAPTPPAPCE